MAVSGQLPPLKPDRRPAHERRWRSSQLKDVLDAYAQKRRGRRSTSGSATARSTRCYTSLFRELLTYMMEDPRNITFCTHLLFCAKNIERIGDHATNIAETVHYLVTGENLADERPKNDRSSFETDRRRRPDSTTAGTHGDAHPDRRRTRRR